jgi:hypothetical protein
MSLAAWSTTTVPPSLLSLSLCLCLCFSLSLKKASFFPASGSSSLAYPDLVQGLHLNETRADRGKDLESGFRELGLKAQFAAVNKGEVVECNTTGG